MTQTERVTDINICPKSLQTWRFTVIIKKRREYDRGSLSNEPSLNTIILCIKFYGIPCTVKFYVNFCVKFYGITCSVKFWSNFCVKFYVNFYGIPCPVKFCVKFCVKFYVNNYLTHTHFFHPVHFSLGWWVNFFPTSSEHCTKYSFAKMIKYKFTHICVAKLENIDLSILGGAGYTQFWDRAHTCYFSLPTYFAQQEREAGKRKMKVKRERERG